jgi:hypothetical protein
MGMERFADRHGPGWNRTLVRTEDSLTIGLTVRDVVPAGR